MTTHERAIRGYDSARLWRHGQMTLGSAGMAGSLRRESLNRRLLHSAAREMPPGAKLTMWDGLGAIPPFSEDLEVAPAPAGVAELRQVIAEADVLLFATPSTRGRYPASYRASRGFLGSSPLLGYSPTPQ